MRSFKVIEEETDAVFLNEKELAAIYALDLSNDKELENIRDVFIVGCILGLRYLLRIDSIYEVRNWGVSAKLNQRVEIVRKKGKDRVTDVFQKWELIFSHTCRRSFCTNMYLSGFPAEELMKISGHKSVATFMRYIKVDNLQAADRLKELRSQIKR